MWRARSDVGLTGSVGFSPDNIIAARRRIEQLAVPAPVRARSFSIYVGLIERADPSGHLSELAADFLADFGLNRGSWSTYRRVLLDAELIEIGRSPTDLRARPIRLRRVT
jgi:hypothetical protein